MKKNSVLTLLISVTIFHIGCSTNSNRIEELKSDIESVDNNKIKQSKIILGKENLMATFDVNSVDNIQNKESKFVLGKENLKATFNIKSVDNIGINP